LSPILQVIGDVAGTVLGKIWNIIKAGLTCLYHVGTLGLAWIGAKFGKAVAAKACTTPATSTPAAGVTMTPAK
jgi:hypothetical protein